MESLEEMFGIPTVRTSKRLSRVVAARLRPFGITPEQWTVLKRVSEAEYSTQKQLAERADKDQATLTKILDLLEKQNWIQRVRNPEDAARFYSNNRRRPAFKNRSDAFCRTGIFRINISAKRAASKDLYRHFTKT